MSRPKPVPLSKSLSSVEGGDEHDVTLQPRLDGLVAQARFHVLCGAIVAVDGEQLGFRPVAEDTGARVAGGAGQRATAQRAIDVNRASGDDFGAGRDRSEEHTSELQSLRHLVCRLLPPPVSPLFPYTTLFRSWLRRLGSMSSAVR